MEHGEFNLAIRARLKMTVTLRPFQAELKREIYARWQRGVRNVLAVSPTGSGKTVLFSDILHSAPGASVAIAHRQELVSQISLALARNGVRHRIIGPKAVARACSAIHVGELRRTYVDPTARCAVAGVDTLIRMDGKDPWFAQVGLWVSDESHHLLVDNKWGQATRMFPNAYGLGVTATPCRADGYGLGRHADGLMDEMIVGPSMRDLIEQGFLTEYRIFAPPSDINMSQVTISAGGDYSPPKLAAAVHGSHIVGDVVAHYLRIAPGKLGVTFAVDVAAASEQAAAFRQAGVPSEVVSAKTPDALRVNILRRFAAGEIKQLCNCDLFGEGFDLPAIEVVSMARPTASFSLYCLDPETEVLTPQGWQRSDTAIFNESVIAFDLSDNSCRAVPITGSVYRNLRPNECMYELNGPHLNMAVSDQHDLLVKGNTETAVNWQKQTAEHVAARKSLMRVPVAAYGEFPGADLTDNELRFLGWFLSDGSRNKKNNAICISQSAAKTNHLISICETLIGCGFKFGMLVQKRKNVPKTHNDLIKFSISKGAPRGTGKELRGWSKLEKWIDKSIPPCYDDMTARQLRVLLETWNLGDGVNNHNSLDYVKRTLTITCGDNQGMADRLQALCVQRGLRCNIATSHYPGKSRWFVAHIREVTTATIAGTSVTDGTIGEKKTYRRSRLSASEYRPEYVWCVTNPLGTLITRRNGKVVIMGNCQQFGRSMRIMDGKQHAIVIDHVGNVHRHGLPDAPRVWTLDRRERRSRSAPDDVVKVRTCPECTGTYERVLGLTCPFCGHTVEPIGRSGPDQVDGDLAEMTPEALALLRGEIDKAPTFPYGAAPEVIGAIKKRHREKAEAQTALREAMAAWGGIRTAAGDDIATAQRRFWLTYGYDVATAQTLNRAEAEELRGRIGL